MIVFSLIHMSGDPIGLMAQPGATRAEVELMKEALGLKEPLHVQYWVFISGAVRGDFGESIRWKRPAMKIFMERFPNTLQLALAAMVWAILVGLSVGIISAVKMGSWFDNFGKIFALIGQATPTFWLGLMLMLVFAVNLLLMIFL